MKKTVLSLTLAASVLALGACSGGDDKAIITSKVGDISVADFNEKAKALTGSFVMQQMLTEKILADKYDVTDKEVKEAYDMTAAQFGDGFAQALAESGLTEEGFKDSLRVQLLQEKAVKDSFDTKKYYEQMKTELNGRHILVADEATAKEVIEKIKGGAKFADVAKEYSIDTGSAEKGGELGWFSVGAMVDEFNDAAYALELNTLSEPVQSSFGYHVIEITEKRDVEGIGSFEEEEENIVETMFARLKQTGADQALAKDIVAKLAKETDIKTSDKDLEASLKVFTTTSEEQAKAAEEEAKKAEEAAKKEADKKDDKAEETDEEAK
ncbi:peptidylprolyl isomerase [Lysinibacillus macroides]|uniref:Foldase protein PrsA n=1 Tax=Lysinibacillus macroides TaxID=33935 RepID=A0A0M9DIR0_9BACI|nr:peptidylprolyl isomerase [Lysinibacillus macroides]KOY82248.1 foldase [Lysinibacillus macroides]QPR68168.1 peptidylprolyl isomerase [Lysinibacillus macroides]